MMEDGESAPHEFLIPQTLTNSNLRPSISAGVYRAAADPVN
jgi:hypothetical protein